MEKTILEFLQVSNENFIAPCNGKKKCGKCKVIITNRNVAINEYDLIHLSQTELDLGYRLACSHRYHDGDIIEYPESNGKIEDNLYLEKEIIINQSNEGIGIVIDIGTTTVALKEVNLTDGKVNKSKSFFNPQAKFGSDVIARIEYDNHDHKSQLSEIIIQAIFKEIAITDNLKKIIVCGNATMLNLFLKQKVKSIGVSPFTVPILEMINKNISYFITTTKQIPVTMVNHISAYVGSDIVMGIYATDMDIKRTNCLLMDLGTNGELVIGNKDKLLVTSCPAGPAFEGVNIECGGPSVDGAICQTWIKEGKILYETINHKEANSICGSGLISLIANLIRLELIDEVGNFVDGSKRYNLTDNVYLSIKDIKAFILAKAAIQAGKEVLLKYWGLPIDTIYIAGGFGNCLIKEDLVTLNIIAENEQNLVKYINNSAISGSYKLLLTQEFTRVKQISNLAEVIYLEQDNNFNDYWLDAMVFE